MHRLAIIFSVLLILNPFYLFAQDDGTERISGEQLLDRFLYDFITGLDEKGVNPGELPSSRSAVWNALNPTQLEEAIHRFYGDRVGGFVTSEQIYPPDEQIGLVSGDRDSSLYIRIPGSSDQYYYGSRIGMAECDKRELSGLSDMPLFFALHHNIRCHFVEIVRDYFLPLGLSPIIAYDDIIQSEAFQLTEQYIQELQRTGYIQRYEERFDEGFVLVFIPGWTHGHKVMVHADLVNPFTTISEEIHYREQTLSYETEGVFLYPLREQEQRSYGQRMFAVHWQSLQQGLRSLDVNMSPEQKKRTILDSLDLIERESDGPDTCNPVYHQYSGDRVTPADTRIAYYIAPDPNRQDYAFIRMMKNLGYSVDTINDPYRPLQHVVDEAHYCPIRENSVVFFNMHGSQSSGSFQCNNGIQYGSRDCCWYLYYTGLSLGLDVSNIDCTLPVVRTGAASRDFILNSVDSADEDCYGSKSSRAPVNRCLLQLNLSRAWGPLSPWPEKAIVASDQCGGGYCASGSIPKVKDMMVFSKGDHLTTRVRCDFDLAAKDMSGKSQYCQTVTSGLKEPFADKDCSEQSRLTPVDPTVSRSFQSVAALRGSMWPAGRIKQAWLGCEESSTGFQAYQHLNAAGDPSVEVELFPTVADVLTSLESGTSGTITLQLSSALATQASHPIAPNFPEFYSSRPIFLDGGSTQYDPTANQISLQVNTSNLSLAPRLFWRTKPEDLRRDYGYDQQNWPWYLGIKIATARAPNGVLLVGNESAPKKWVYPGPDDVAAPRWKKFNGEVSPGNYSFEARVPAKPLFACCKPNLEFDDGSMKQNGCGCVDVDKIHECRTTSCCIDDSCTIDTYSDQASCEADDGEWEEFGGDLIEWGVCCASTDECEAIEREDFDVSCPRDHGAVKSIERHQYIELPLDLSEPAQCDPIIRKLDCSRSGSSVSKSSRGGSSGPGGTGLSKNLGGGSGSDPTCYLNSSSSSAGELGLCKSE